MNGINLEYIPPSDGVKRLPKATPSCYYDPSMPKTPQRQRSKRKSARKSGIAKGLSRAPGRPALRKGASPRSGKQPTADRYKRELEEALEYQRATSEVLDVISRASAEVQPVLDAIVQTAARLCAAEYSFITRYQDGKGHLVAANRMDSEHNQYLLRNPVAIDRGSVTGRVALERKTVHVPDVLNDPEFNRLEWQKVGKQRTVLGVPLLRDNELLGTIILARTIVSPFTSKQIQLVTTFANQAVIAIENARLFDQVQARTRELTEALQQQTATADVLKVISRSPFELQTVLETLTASASRLCEAEMAAVTRPRGEDGAHFHATNFGFPAAWFSYMQTYPIKPSRGTLVGRTLLEKRAVHIPDVLADPEYTAARAQQLGHFRAILGVPLLRGENVIGVFMIARRAPQPFSEKQIEVVTTFADQAVIAIENARLFDEVQARTRELSETLEQQVAASEILRTIAKSPGNVLPVFETVARSVARLCNVRFCQVFRFDGKLIHFAAHHGLSPEAIDDIRRTYPMAPGGASAVGRAILNREIALIPDIDANPAYGRRRFASLMGFRSVVAVPILKDDCPIGAIAMARPESGTFPERQIELLRAFADQATIALENARLFDEVQARTRDVTEALQQQTATADVLKVISRSTFDLQTVLSTLVEAAARLCEADGAAMARERGGVQYQVAYYGTPPGYADFVKNIPLAPGRGSVVGRVLLARKPVQVADAQADAEFTHHNIREFLGFRTLLGVPLLREGHPIGVLVIWRKTVRPFNDRQVELVSTFADQAVIAIENTRLFDEIQEKTRQLEIADKYKSHFLASASHDLRQPLHALNLFVSQLRSQRDPAALDRLIERIEAAVTSMNELFGALLDMSKLEAGILEAHVSSFPLSRIFERIDATFSDLAKQKGLRLRIVPSRAWVRSDFVLLERILMNLVSNAIRHISRGDVVLGCRRRGQSVRVDVVDSGQGIPPDQQQSIFAEYYRLERSRQDGSGFGFGLAIVKRLSDLLGHPIELRSRIGHGSRFSVTVPLVHEQHGAMALVPANHVSDPAQGKCVLIIDDDSLVLDGMSGILSSWGCTVLRADSLPAALESLSSDRHVPDLLIADYQLGHGTTGIQAVTQLRARVGANVPAFLISGDTAPDRLRDARENGLQLLHKPVAPMRLRAMINQLLRARPGGGSPPA